MNIKTDRQRHVYEIWHEGEHVATTTYGTDLEIARLLASAGEIAALKAEVERLRGERAARDEILDRANRVRKIHRRAKIEALEQVLADYRGDDNLTYEGGDRRTCAKICVDMLAKLKQEGE